MGNDHLGRYRAAGDFLVSAWHQSLAGKEPAGEKRLAKRTDSDRARCPFYRISDRYHLKPIRGTTASDQDDRTPLRRPQQELLFEFSVTNR